jgi:hypothetical protein
LHDENALALFRKFAGHITLKLMGQVIVTSEIIDDLVSVARRFVSDIQVEAVPSIQDWCKAIGMPEDNPFVCGKTVQDRQTGRHLVLLAERITPEMQASVISAMEFHAKLPHEDIASLTDPQVFVKHLLLHEVAHATGHDRSEEECDRWAFQQLRVA